jgi:NAD(P)-dependent dehydrogenase (short-subunit alcohol dehydrogenase family)
MADLQGRVALVTGGGRGLGAATARELAAARAAVAVVARSGDEVAAVAEAIRRDGRQALGIAADAGQWDSVRAAVEQTRAALGPIAILVNNAAMSPPFATVAESDPVAWAYALAVDLHGPFFFAHATLPDMLAADWGRIINISSGAAVGANPAMSAYSVAKAGLDHLTRLLAAELAATGVAAITIYPGIMDTAMQTEAREQESPAAGMFRDYHAHGFLRPPAEPARLVRWLCGAEGDAYRGQGVNVFSTAIRQKIGLPDLPEPLRRP